MPKINLTLLSIKPTYQISSFSPLLLYLSRDYFKEDGWCLNQGLMGQKGFKATLNNKNDLQSMVYLLKGEYLLVPNQHSLMIHSVISWQSSSTHYLSIKKELSRFLDHHQPFYRQALWFIHNNTLHPHVHILLFSDNHKQQLLQSLKRNIKNYIQMNSDVRTFSNNDLNHELVHTKPFTFYQWVRRYLKDQLVEYVDMPQSNWHQFQSILNYCHIQLLPRHNSFVWSTSLNGRSIHIKPSLLDKKLSSHFLLNKWGPYLPTNSINTLSKVNYQRYHLFFHEHRVREFFYQNNHYESVTLAQLIQHYYFTNSSQLSFNNQKSDSLYQKKQYAIIDRLSKENLLSAREHHQLKKQILNIYLPHPLINKQVNKKISWLHFLIKETYKNNMIAKSLLKDIWQNHDLQPKLLNAFINTMNTAEQRIDQQIQRSAKKTLEIER
ncbi:hypothetical protein LHV13_04540 [Ferrovum sp. PN-J185]|uniref:hypothetical protein n=1 Tax=Ferrovum sp. PN-J185 TaxID=1356306 RepID=UPI001E3437B4|nr:hypothetical protein [Ferrovum sp. PN-J185]MCC6068445.1 hypothetical protein [Ferrovum sp. PN-J185]